MLIGTRYKLQNKLGQGAMGVVYQAIDKIDNKPIAIKQIQITPQNLSFSSKTSFSDKKIALINEFRILAGLRHPNIISVYDYGLHNGQAYLVMDLLAEALHFDKAIQTRSTESRIALIMQILEALDYLHRRNIIHRDLKPANVLVVNDTVKVLDFGLSVTGEIGRGRVGTMAYMAPETLKTMTTVPQSDLYTVGLMIYEALLDKRPFESGDVIGILKKIPDTSMLDDHPVRGVIDRLLLKSPEDRYVSARDTLNALAYAMDYPVYEDQNVRESFLQTAPFVGRKNELEQLKRAIHKASQGNGSAWLVGGESGIGKSRFIDEIRIHALVEGYTVLIGQGIDGGGLPYQLWRSIMRYIVLAVPLTPLEKQILKDIVPDINSLLGEDIVHAPDVSDIAEQDRMVSTIADVIKRYAKPLLLILEDLQWSSNLDPLNLLNRAISDLPLVIIGSYRNDERRDLPHQLLNVDVIDLQRLDDSNISELMVGILGDVGYVAPINEFVRRETEGNAFFMVEVLRALAEEAGALSEIGQMTLPDKIMAQGIQTIVRRRLDRLPSWGRTLLKAVAVVGRQIDTQITSILAREHLQQHTIEEWLQACNEASILEVVNNQWRFSHDKLREALLFDLTPTEHRNFHQQVAQSIEACYPDDTNYQDILLEHWHQAGNLDKEVFYLLPTVRRMVSLVAQYDLAYRLLDRCYLNLAEDNPHRPYVLLEKMNLLATQGKHDDAKQIAKQVEAIAIQSKDDFILGYYHRILGMIEREDGNLDVATEHFQASLTLYQGLHDELRTAYVMNDLANLANTRGKNQMAQDYFHRAIDIYERLGKREEALRSIGNLGLTYLNNNQYDRAYDYIQQRLTFSRESGNRASLRFDLSNLGDVVFAQENYTEAVNLYSESLALKYEIDDSGWSICYTLVRLGFAQLALQEIEPATETFTNALQLYTRGNVRRALILQTLLGFAWIFHHHGKIKRAIEYICIVQAEPSEDVRLQARLDFVLDNIHIELQQQSTHCDVDTVVSELIAEFLLTD